MPRNGAAVTWCSTLQGTPTIFSMYCISVVSMSPSGSIQAHHGTAAIVQHAKFTSRTCTFRAPGGGSKCGAIRHFRNPQTHCCILRVGIARACPSQRAYPPLRSRTALRWSIPIWISWALGTVSAHLFVVHRRGTNCACVFPMSGT